MKEPWEYDSLDERLADTTRLKERGGKYFKAEKYKLAMKLYKRGAELITDTSLRKEDTREKAKPLRVALHLNLAACHLKLDELTEALKECQEVKIILWNVQCCGVWFLGIHYSSSSSSQVIIDDDENVKAFFRSGQV